MSDPESFDVSDQAALAWNDYKVQRATFGIGIGTGVVGVALVAWGFAEHREYDLLIFGLVFSIGFILVGAWAYWSAARSLVRRVDLSDASIAFGLSSGATVQLAWRGSGTRIILEDLSASPHVSMPRASRYLVYAPDLALGGSPIAKEVFDRVMARVRELGLEVRETRTQRGKPLRFASVRYLVT